MVWRFGFTKLADLEEASIPDVTFLADSMLALLEKINIFGNREVKLAGYSPGMLNDLED